MIKANDPSLKTWLSVDQNSDFPIQNIPFGMASIGGQKKAVSRIGNTVIDLSELYKLNFFEAILSENVFDQDYLNAFLEKNKKTWRDVREKLSIIFQNETYKQDVKSALHPLDSVTMEMPVKVGDYTDFYSSRQHAFNVGCMFRDPENALLPNWLHIPVGYHGRASSIILSGQNIHRPKGQQLPLDANSPVFGPCKLLDFELEMAFVTGQGKPLGESIDVEEADDYIFGMVIFNDWSARDIQKWEYVPLGPFLAKNFASSISPWIITLDALEPFRCKGEKQEPEVLPYLQYRGQKNIDIKLKVQIQSDSFDAHTVSESNYKYMYWNMNQQLAHHSVNGCNIQAGDMMASGTISGNEESAYGSMLELSWKGTKPLKMPDGSERKFINDGDTVIMKAHCQKENVRIGFGEVKPRCYQLNNELLMQSINPDIERKEILNRYRGLLRDCRDKTNKEEKRRIRKAFNIAVEAHKDMRRKSGEPYIYHPIDVARIAAKDIGLGTTSIICSLLHDVVEDTDYSLKDIKELFGTKEAKIIDGLTKISEVYDQNVSMQAENFRKMLLTLSDDIRVILIKLADRLHNMRTLASMPKHKQLKIASETLYLYAPLAHRLGLYAIKTELEDLGLKYTKSEIYKAISEKLAETKSQEYDTSINLSSP